MVKCYDDCFCLCNKLYSYVKLEYVNLENNINLLNNTIIEIATQESYDCIENIKFCIFILESINLSGFYSQYLSKVKLYVNDLKQYFQSLLVLNTIIS